MTGQRLFVCQQVASCLYWNSGWYWKSDRRVYANLNGTFASADRIRSLYCETSLSLGTEKTFPGFNCFHIHRLNNPPSGVYWINPNNVTSGAFQVYCDMDDKDMYDNAGCTVIQRRDWVYNPNVFKNRTDTRTASFDLALGSTSYHCILLCCVFCLCCYGYSQHLSKSRHSSNF